MSKKSKRRAAARAALKTKNIPVEKKAKSSSPNRKKTVIISLIAITLIASIVIGTVFLILKTKSFDYMKEDLTSYIELSETDYKGYTLSLVFDDVSDRSVERKIMALLYQNRSEEALYDGGNIINLNLPINVGDKVKIYFRGYTVDENGKEIEISGASNLFSGVYPLEIGSLSFIEGFEESLVGVIPSAYPKFEYKKSGEFVAADDVIYLSYKSMLPDGSYVSRESERIDLSLSDIDSVYGIGFKDGLVGLEIGKKISESMTFALDGGSAVYFDMKVDYATDCEREPLTVNTRFPANYQEESLRGKEAYFDVYFEEVIAYDTPEYNEDFILNTLKLTLAELSSYDGESVEEKHRAKLWAEAEDENEEVKKSLIEEAVWEHLNSKVKIKKLPQSEIEKIYNEYCEEIEATYQDGYNSYLYSSLDAFAAAYLEIEDSRPWRDYVMERAEDVVVEKLIFYYIIRREEGFLPTSSEFDTLYDGAVSEYLSYYTDDFYKEELDKISDESERQKRILEIKNEMLNYFGQEYFEEMVYYEFALDKIISLANITDK